MWSFDPRWTGIARVAAICALAGLTAGCFQPLYGEYTLASTGNVTVADRLSAVDVPPIDAPRGTRLARVGSQVHNDLIFGLTGGAPTPAPAYRLTVKLNSSIQQVIVDINTARPDIQNYGIDAYYTLVDIRTGKPVVTGTTFARVSFDIPGQQQRFAGERGLRDAEDRAAQVIADGIRSRLASYFVAGT
jgi:LPS-assembly lipoprotein